MLCSLGWAWINGGGFSRIDLYSRTRRLLAFPVAMICVCERFLAGYQRFRMMLLIEVMGDMGCCKCRYG